LPNLRTNLTHTHVIRGINLFQALSLRLQRRNLSLQSGGGLHHGLGRSSTAITAWVLEKLASFWAATSICASSPHTLFKEEPLAVGGADG